MKRIFVFLKNYFNKGTELFERPNTLNYKKNKIKIIKRLHTYCAIPLCYKRCFSINGPFM